jgi:hypothetical protein
MRMFSLRCFPYLPHARCLLAWQTLRADGVEVERWRLCWPGDVS